MFNYVDEDYPAISEIQHGLDCAVFYVPSNTV